MTDQFLVYEVPHESLDASNSGEFKATILSKLKGNPNLVLDLNRLEFLDSSGLGAFLAALRRANSLGGDIKLCRLTPAVRSIFELVRMNRIFEIFNDLEELRASLSADADGAAW